MLPPSVGSLNAFFETEGKTNPQNEIRPQKLGLDGIIENLLKFNVSNEEIGNQLVVERLDIVIDRLDSLLEKNAFGGLFGGFRRNQIMPQKGLNAPGLNIKILTENFNKISSAFKENTMRIVEFGKENIIGALSENIIKTKDIFSRYTKSITSSFTNIKNALNPQTFVEFLSGPIKSFIKPINESITNLKKDVSNVFEGVGDIIAAPFRMMGNVTSFLFNKDKGYPFERLEKDIDLTNRTVTAIEKSIREVLIKELQFNILDRVVSIDERLRTAEVRTETNELQQIETVNETARLEDQRADKQNDLLASIAEKIGGLGVAEAKKDQAEESGKGLLDKLLEKLGLGDMKSLKGLGGNLMMKGGLALGGGLLGISALSDMSENYDKRMKGEDTFMDYLGTIGQGAASGAMIGGMFGPMGALVGGGIGAAVTGAGSLITALTPSQKEAEEKRAKAWEDQQNEVALKSLEEREMFDRNLFGESKIDESKLDQMSVRELKSLLSLEDFSASDIKKIETALEKRVELDSRVQEESKKKTEESRSEAQAQYQGMTNEEQIAKLETEKSKIVEQLKTAKASDTQIQQVIQDFDKSISALKTNEEQIAKLETEKSKIVEQLKTAKASDTQIQQVIQDFDKSISALKTNEEQIAKLETEKSKIVEQLKTAKASDTQIQQVIQDFDKSISALKTTETPTTQEGTSRMVGQIQTMPDGTEKELVAYDSSGNPIWASVGTTAQDLERLRQNSQAMLRGSQPTTEADIRKPADVATDTQMNVVQGTVDSMAMKTAAEVGSAVSPIISSNSSSNASSIVVNAPATTINSARGNTYQGIKSTISMNN